MPSQRIGEQKHREEDRDLLFLNFLIMIIQVPAGRKDRSTRKQNLSEISVLKWPFEGNF